MLYLQECCFSNLGDIGGSSYPLLAKVIMKARKEASHQVVLEEEHLVGREEKSKQDEKEDRT